MLRNLLLAGSIAASLVALLGCASEVGNDGAVVGGSCVVNGECAVQSRCLDGAAWPGGYCAKLCVTDADCPGGSQCAEIEGGRCVVTCASAGGCRSDDGYDCVELEARGAGGTVMGCALP
jgi:hypothetical protein